MADPAALLGLPALIASARALVQEHAPRGGVAGAFTAGLIGYLALAELAAEQMLALTPANASVAHGGPRQVLAPVGDLEGPLVPRRPIAPGTGLPPGRPHP